MQTTTQNKKMSFWAEDMLIQFGQQFNTEPFENCILGTLLIDESHYELVKEFIKPQMFSPKNKMVASLIFEMLECCEPLKKNVILERASQNKVQITSNDIDQYRFQSSVEELENSIYLFVKNWYSYQKSVNATQFVANIQNGLDVVTASAIMDKTNEEIEALKEQTDENKYDFKQQINLTIQDIESRKKDPASIKGISSGFPDFDRLTGGFLGQNLYAICGESGGGKSTLGLQMVSYALTKGATDFYSLEMSPRQIIPKLFSAKTGIHTIRMNTGAINEDELSELKATAKVVENTYNLKIIDDLFTIEEIRKSIIMRAKRYNTKLIIIDHLGIIQSSSNKKTNEKYDDIAYELKRIAKKINVPIILLAQRNQDNKTRANKLPVTSDMAFGGKAACDLIVFPHRPEFNEENAQEFKDESECSIVITKNREGLIGSFKMIFVSSYNMYCEIDENNRPILPKDVNKNTQYPTPKATNNIITQRGNIEDLPF